jgi:protein-tyrosine-phosphatase
MKPPSRFRVLFVCIGNACRSPMAESIARRDAADIIEPSSAGLYPLGRVSLGTEEVLLANGYSVDELSSKPLRSEAIKNADLIINLSGERRELIFDDPSRVEDWKVADPYGEDPAIYQRILEEIEGRVRLLASRLREGDRSAK